MANHLNPGRARRGTGQQVAPDLLGVGAPAILIGRHAHVEARHDVLGVLRQRTLESGFGLAGDDAIGGGHHGLAEIGLALGIAAVQADDIAPGPDRIVKTAEAHIDRRQHLPGAAIFGVARDVIFHLRDHIFDLAGLALRLRPARQRGARQIRRTQHQVEREGANRQQDKTGDGGDAAVQER